MREKISIDRNWFFREEIPSDQSFLPTWKMSAYSSAKTMQKINGPASYSHKDQPDHINFYNEATSETWERVSLPHDYLINDEPRKEYNAAWGFIRPRNAWYRRHFQLPDKYKNKRISLFFEGVSGNSEIYLNGSVLRYNHCGYTPFECDISDRILWDKDNVIAVYIDMHNVETWSYPGAGIYRHAFLVVTDRVCVDLYGTYIYPQKKENLWELPVWTTIRNDRYEDIDVLLLHEIIDENGQIVHSFETSDFIPLREKKDIKCSSFVEDPQLWNPEEPHLYTLKTHVFAKEEGTAFDFEETDLYETRFGFRDVKFDPVQGLFINDKPVKIKGVCNHQDFGLTGKAVPDNVSRYMVTMLKRMGANGYRCSHYPQNEALMDALDENGFLVMVENRHFDSTPEVLEQVEIHVKRDRNRPSVLFWSTSNEEVQYHTLEQGANIQRALRAHIHKFDPNRPVSAAAGFPEKCVIYEDVDLLFLNYRFAVLDEFHEKYPKLPIVSSENVAVGTTFGVYFGSRPSEGREESYDHDRNAETQYYGREGTWKMISERPFVMGGYQWVAIDHRGEAQWPRICSASGAIDMFLRPKDAYYQNQSHWLDSPIIHLFPHWNHRGLEGELIQVWAYTNCDEAELFLNGKSLGRKDIEKNGHGSWDVSYVPGRLEVIGYQNGKEVARDFRETTGNGASLGLRVLNGPFYAGQDDVALLEAFVLDAEGREVPDAAPLLHFECSLPGTLIGTGSDNTDHVPVSSPERRMYMGRVLVGIRIGDEAKPIRVYAHAKDQELVKASLEIKVLPFGTSRGCPEAIKKEKELGGHVS